MPDAPAPESLPDEKERMAVLLEDARIPKVVKAEIEKRMDKQGTTSSGLAV